MNNRYVLLVLAIIVIFLGSAYRIPQRALEAAQSAIPSNQAPETSTGAAVQSNPSKCFPGPQNPGFKCIPRDRRGNVMQLDIDGAGLPGENAGLPILGGGR